MLTKIKKVDYELITKRYVNAKGNQIITSIM